MEETADIKDREVKLQEKLEKMGCGLEICRPGNEKAPDCIGYIIFKLHNNYGAAAVPSVHFLSLEDAEEFAQAEKPVFPK